MIYAVFDAFWSLKNDTDDEQKFQSLITFTGVSCGLASNDNILRLLTRCCRK
jgi:hypothetical protein